MRGVWTSVRKREHVVVDTFRVSANPQGARGSDYLGLLMNLKRKNGRIRAIDLAKLIVILFPAFRDQVDYHGRRCQSLN
jgi:hypothetical protein